MAIEKLSASTLEGASRLTIAIKEYNLPIYNIEIGDVSSLVFSFKNSNKKVLCNQRGEFELYFVYGESDKIIGFKAVTITQDVGIVVCWLQNKED